MQTEIVERGDWGLKERRKGEEKGFILVFAPKYLMLPPTNYGPRPDPGSREVLTRGLVTDSCASHLLLVMGWCLFWAQSGSLC